MHAPTRAPRVPLLVQIIIALFIGGITGALAGPRVAVCGELAVLFVKLLKLLATPLIFVAIVDTFASTKLPARRALVLLPVSTTNAVVAAGIAIGLAHLLPLGRFVDLGRLRALVLTPTPPPPHAVVVFGKQLDRLLVDNLLWVVGAAILTGIFVRVAKATALAHAARTAFHVLMRILGVVVQAVPLAAFGITAKVVGTSGLAIFPVLGLFVATVALGMIIHVFCWYTLLLRFVARARPGEFFRLAADPLSTALGIGSSLATLPVTLKTLEERMGVSPESARLAAVVGTNLNHDGIVLYEAAAALFVAQLYGVDVGLAAQLKLVGLAILAAVGIAGVPEAGMMTLTMVLGRAGLPVSAASLLLPVDWILNRLRATTNVASDLVVARVLDRFR
jgi:Na+/H+-dicarboxylate symporter